MRSGHHTACDMDAPFFISTSNNLNHSCLHTVEQSQQPTFRRSVLVLQFMVFTGVVAFLIAIFYSAVSCAEGLQPTFSGTLIEVAVNAIWVIFWLAAAASFASHADCSLKQVRVELKLSCCNVFLASEAFAWLSWFFWIASLVVSIIEMRRGSGEGCEAAIRLEDQTT